MESNFWAGRAEGAREKRRHSEPGSIFNPSSLPNESETLLKNAISIHRSPVLSDDISRFLPSSFSKDNARLLAGLPLAQGGVRHVSLPADGRSQGTVVLIQDVHLHPEAQANISKTLQSLAATGEVALFGLEGAWNSVDLSWFRDFPDREAVKNVAEDYLQANKITGGAHGAMTAAGSFPKVLGVDDRAHYMANIAAYKEAAPLQGRLRFELAAARQKLASLADRAFPAELRTLVSAAQDFHANRMPLTDYALILARSPLASEKASVGTFLTALALEKSIRFDAVDAQRNALIADLARELNEKEMQRLLERALALRAGTLRAGDYYSTLPGVCERAGLSLSKYPDFQNYVRYVGQTEKINATILLRDLQEVERSAQERLAKTPEQKRLLGAFQWIGFADRLADFALTTSEWDAYQSLRKDALPLRTPLAPFENFFREAKIRDRAMADNLIRDLSLKPGRNAALVVGGFHAAGLTSVLNSAGWSVVVFTPRVTKIDEKGGSYLSVFNQEKTPLDKLFAGDRLSITIEPAPGAAVAEMGAEILRRSKLSPEIRHAQAAEFAQTLGRWLPRGASALINGRGAISVQGGGRTFPLDSADSPGRGTRNSPYGLAYQAVSIARGALAAAMVVVLAACGGAYQENLEPGPPVTTPAVVDRVVVESPVYGFGPASYVNTATRAMWTSLVEQIPFKDPAEAEEARGTHRRIPATGGLYTGRAVFALPNGGAAVVVGSEKKVLVPSIPTTGQPQTMVEVNRPVAVVYLWNRAEVVKTEWEGVLRTSGLTNEGNVALGFAERNIVLNAATGALQANVGQLILPADEIPGQTLDRVSFSGPVLGLTGFAQQTPGERAAEDRLLASSGLLEKLSSEERALVNAGPDTRIPSTGGLYADRRVVRWPTGELVVAVIGSLNYQDTAIVTTPGTVHPQTKSWGYTWLYVLGAEGEVARGQYWGSATRLGMTDRGLGIEFDYPVNAPTFASPGIIVNPDTGAPLFKVNRFEGSPTSTVQSASTPTRLGLALRLGWGGALLFPAVATASTGGAMVLSAVSMVPVASLALFAWTAWTLSGRRAAGRLWKGLSDLAANRRIRAEARRAAQDLVDLSTRTTGDKAARLLPTAAPTLNELAGALATTPVFLGELADQMRNPIFTRAFNETLVSAGRRPLQRGADLSTLLADLVWGAASVAPGKAVDAEVRLIVSDGSDVSALADLVKRSAESGPSRVLYLIVPRSPAAAGKFERAVGLEVLNLSYLGKNHEVEFDSLVRAMQERVSKRFGGSPSMAIRAFNVPNGFISGIPESLVTGSPLEDLRFALKEALLKAMGEVRLFSTDLLNEIAVAAAVAISA